MIVILVTRQAAAEAEYEVSIFGGYEDENATSEDITESLLMAMQVYTGCFPGFCKSETEK